MSSLSTLPKGDSAWLLRKSIQRIMQQVSVLETNIGSSTTGNSANTQVIFNDNGTLRGDTGLTFNKTTDTLGTGRLTTSGDAIVCSSTGDFYVGSTVTPQFKVERATGSATITGDLTVDTNVLKVNTTTNRVGINTTTPSQNLEITGSGNPLSVDGCSAVRLNNTVSGRPAVVGVDDSQNFVIWNVGTEVSETIKFLTGGGNGKEQYRITHGGVFNWYDGAGGTRMTLNSTGLGVGLVPSGGAKLAIRDSGSNDSYIGLGANNDIYLSTGAAGIHYFRKGGAAASMMIDAAGNVGVGITPSYRLQSAVASGADGNIFAAQVIGASNGFQVLWNHATTTTRVIIANIPTSSAGLAAGTLWNDAGTIKIA